MKEDVLAVLVVFARPSVDSLFESLLLGKLFSDRDYLLRLWVLTARGYYWLAVGFHFSFHATERSSSQHYSVFLLIAWLIQTRGFQLFISIFISVRSSHLCHVVYM